jgi:cytochrome c-type biogenesis protein CcmE
MSAEQRKRRIVAIAALGVVVTALGVLAFGGIGENLVFYWSPTEIMEAGDEAEDAVIRLGGVVEEGSVKRGNDGLQLDFSVTDGAHSVPVHAEEVPPAMFREGVGVLIEGTMGADGVFQSKRLLVKHDNEYRAPESEKQADMDELVKSMNLEKGEN